jgi:hypothetical protein
MTLHIMSRNFVKFPSYNGEIRFTKNKISSPGEYAIEAY